MGSLLLVVPFAVLVAVAVAVTTLVVPRRRALPAADGSSPVGLRRLRTATVTTRLVGLLLGALLVGIASGLGGLGRGLMLAPILFGGMQVLAVLICDVLTRDAARTPGVAALEVRRARDLLPPKLTLAALAAALLLAGLLAWTTATASADSLGRAGRVLSYRCVAGCETVAVGPWPGSYYSLPLALGLGIVALLTVVAIRRTVQRPRNGADRQILRIDGAIRRRAAESTAAGAGIAVAGSLAGVASNVGLRLLDADQSPASLHAAMWLTLLLAVCATVLLVWCVTVLLLPGSGRAPLARHPATAGR